MIEKYHRELSSLLNEDDGTSEWLDKKYLSEIANEIIYLKDYVPKYIELNLPDYELRSSFIDHNTYLIDDDFLNKQILDQCVGDTTWQEHVSIYDDFFRKHPEFSKLIKDQKAFLEWKLTEPYYF